MSDDFIKHCLKLIDEIFEGVGEYVKKTGVLENRYYFEFNMLTADLTHKLIISSHAIIPHMRRSRYIRNPEKLPHRLTERDINILSIIDRFRYLTSQQIADLLTASRQASTSD